MNTQVFFDHENSSQHLNSIRNKKEIFNVISKGIILHQMVAGGKTQSNASRDRNCRLICKFIKTTYIFTRKKWAVKFNFKDVIDFLDDIGDPEVKRCATEFDVYVNVCCRRIPETDR